MQPVLVIAISLHVLAATFWAGSTFACARMTGNDGQQLFTPQLGAAAVALLSGAYLWKALHEGSFGPTEQLLGAGAVAAIVALVIQITIIRNALRRLRTCSGDAARARSQLATGYRSAAALLAVAALAMAASRYA
ncbi:hypothetical protein XH89_03490 [Bradyrhizobium sp. CCBAU 53340]|uniref:hypothetical protein n=1 Tax=Bradyrhizobium sp. CCBAU 53340 TaxID=1325112 RepID=UPI00188B5BC7|nr:hypothetical protein [Bradyrhizobium sp. CCBAU 53340]QOZ42639.1 hypothetical protein XH89_03490 [Bradyrhizobium sp. CCBAU 53340]